MIKGNMNSTGFLGFVNSLRHLHSIDLDFVYVCSISYTVIGLSQNFYAAVL